MAVDVLTETLINRPAETVSGFAMEPDNAPKWYKNISSAEWRSPRPLRVGSRIAFLATFLGRRLSYTYEITALVPGRRLVMRTAEGPFPMETSYEFEPVGNNQTRMRLRNRGEPSGFGSVFGPIISWAMRRENTKDLARLKAILEATSGAVI
jgi:uncharacterized membrane protein